LGLAARLRDRVAAADARPAADGGGDEGGLPVVVALAFAGHLLVPLLVLYAVATAVLMAGGGLSAATGLLGLAGGFAASAAAVHRWGGIPRAVNAAAAAAVLLGMAGVQAALVPVIDTAFDGQLYHVPAIISLAGDWNPYREFDALARGWAFFYPKAPWMVGAQLFAVTGLFDLVRPVQALLMACGFLALLAALRVEAGRVTAWSVPVALAAALNPVAVNQFPTTLIDGWMASLLLVALSLFLLQRRLEGTPAARLVRLLIAAAGILMVNVKFTGVVYFAGMAGAFWFWRVAVDRRGRDLLFLAPTVLAAVLVFGANPYLTNLTKFGTPFYPPSSFILAGHIPAEMAPMGRVTKLFHNVFGAVSAQPGKVPDLKVPFTLQDGELAALGTEAVRDSGLGPFFSGEVVLAAALALWLLLARAAVSPVLVFAALWAFGLTVIFPEPVYSRYMPQLWLVPLLLLAAVRRPGKAGLVLGVPLLLAAAGNAGTSGASVLAHRRAMAQDWQRALAAVEDRTVRIIDPYFESGRFSLARQWGFPTSLRYRLERMGRGIAFVEPLSCLPERRIAIPGTNLEACRGDPPAYEPGTVLSFAPGGGALPYLLGGWSVGDPWGAWTMGPRADLAMVLPEPVQDDMVMELELFPFLPPGREARGLEVLVNSLSVAHLDVARDGEMRKVAIPLRAADMYGRRDITIRLAVDRPDVPKDLGLGPDDRPLGFGVASLAIRPAAAPAVPPERAPAAEPGRTYRLAEAPEGMLVDGWAGAEAWGVWGVDGRSRLQLRVPDAAGPLTLSFSATVYVPEPAKGREVRLLANGRPVHAWRAAATGFADHAVTLPADVAGPGRVLLLSFEAEPAPSPLEAGAGRDERRLSVGVASVTLAPRGAATGPAGEKTDGR
ncbi:MAG TPA: hypothetical protein VEB20_26345, partial [Azospirillaceae bacterium]|nr:hypothetical protein [Azospirillaceae bacterium]